MAVHRYPFFGKYDYSLQNQILDLSYSYQIKGGSIAVAKISPTVLATWLFLTLAGTMSKLGTSVLISRVWCPKIRGRRYTPVGSKALSSTQLDPEC